MNRLYIIEGLPCSGKSTTSRYVAKLLSDRSRVYYVDEGSGEHPADYEFHAYLSNEEMLSMQQHYQIMCYAKPICSGYTVPLAKFSGELFDKLLQHKIYDFLPWNVEMPVMLEQWRCFADKADKDAIYVFNCVLLQNPMCETMMRFGFPQTISQEYISQIAEIIKPMKPVVIYLKNDDITEQVRKAAQEREGWLESVIDYHINGAYGKSINAQGFEGYIACLEERQRRELDIIKSMPLDSIIIENAHRDWQAAYARISYELD